MTSQQTMVCFIHGLLSDQQPTLRTSTRRSKLTVVYWGILATASQSLYTEPLDDIPSLAPLNAGASPAVDWKEKGNIFFHFAAATH